MRKTATPTTTSMGNIPNILDVIFLIVYAQIVDPSYMRIVCAPVIGRAYMAWHITLNVITVII